MQNFFTDGVFPNLFITGNRGPGSPRYRMFSLFLAFTCCLFAGSGILPAQEMGDHTSSWFGNTGKTGGVGTGLPGHDRLQMEIQSIAVAPDGRVFTNGTWDEAQVLTGVYKDGTCLGQLPGAWLQADGGAVAVNASFVFISVKPGAIRRHNTGDYRRNGTDIKVSNDRVSGMVIAGNELYASDNAGGKIKVYDVNTLALLREFAFPSPGPLTIDGNGYLWGVDRAARVLRKYSSTGTDQNVQISFAAGVSITALGYNAVTGRLMVADNGPDSNVKLYDPSAPSGSPTAPAGALGATGGMWSGTRGEYAPLKFAYLSGVGADQNGNTYVSGEMKVYSNYRGQTMIESYTPDGTLRWDMYNYAWIETGLPDPANENIVYTGRHYYEMDYSRGVGKEVVKKGTTIDPFLNPSDPRRTDDFSTILDVKRLEGQLFTFMTNMFASDVKVYKFNGGTDGKIATHTQTIRSSVGDTWGWCIDDGGDVWQASYAQGIRKLSFQGLDASGNPAWGNLETIPMPAPFTGLRRIEYDKARDVMYLSGYTAEYPNSRNTWGKGAGRVIARYSNWSKGNRTADYEIGNLIYEKDPNKEHGDTFIAAIDIAGDFIFCQYSHQLWFNGTDTPNKQYLEVYRKSDGLYMGYIVPTPDTDMGLAQVDIPYGMRAYQRSNGEYLIFVEDDFLHKVIMHRWNPVNTGPGEDEVYLAGPKGGTTFVAGLDNNITIKAGVSDEDNSIARIEYFANQTKLGESTARPYTFVWQNAPVGDHALTAKAYDREGKLVSTSAAVNVSVISLPDLVVTSVSWTPARPAIGSQVVFSATVKNQGSGATKEGVIIGGVFSVDGKLVNWTDTYTASIPAGGSVVVTASGGPAGSNTWTATAGPHQIEFLVDDINRIVESNETNNRLTVPLCVADAAGLPEVSITGPASGSSFSVGASIGLTAGAGDCGGTVTKVDFYAGTTLIGTATTAPYTVVWPQASAGSYTLIAKATDNEGNTGVSKEVYLIVKPAGTGPIDRTDEPGAIITASGENPPGEGKEKAFDNNTGTKWLDRSSKAWIQHQFGLGNAYAISSYTLTSANDAPGRDPKNWVLKGSSDGTTWKTLDTRTNEAFTSRFQTRTFTFENQEKFAYYRFEFENTDGGDLFQLAEIELIDANLSDTVPAIADLVVTGISWSPAPPAAGTPVTFSATVKNAGTEPTPAGIPMVGEFMVNGKLVGVSDDHTASLAPGASVTLTGKVPSTISGLGAGWVMLPGSHKVTFTVDRVNRIGEPVEKENNTLSGYITDAVCATRSCPQRYEAENARVTRANIVNKSTASGGQVVGGIDFADSKVEFTVFAPEAGAYFLHVYYSNGMGSPSSHFITVNGGEKVEAVYPSRGWDTFTPVKVTVQLNAGENTLAFTKGTLFAELDVVEVEKAYVSLGKYEAEKAAVNRANINNKPGASGGQVVGGIDFADSSVEFAVNITQAGTYQIDVHYANGMGGASSFNLLVNGTGARKVQLPPGRNWDDLRRVRIDVPLKSGNNTVKFSKGDLFAELDMIELLDVQSPSVPTGLVATAVTPYSITLTWDASTDNVGVTGYEVYQDGVKVAAVTAAGHTAAQLAASRGYSFTVKALDAAENSSEASQPLAVSTLAPASVRYEAEQASLFRAMAFSNQPGFSGTGFVRFPSNSGNHVEWTVKSDYAGEHILKFRYANGQPQEQDFRLTVNGTVVNSNMLFSYTGSWSTWGVVEAKVSLPAGSNKIRLTTTGAKNSNLDYLEVTDPLEPVFQPQAAARVAAGPERERALQTVLAYPNPFGDKLTMRLGNGMEGSVQISLHDVQGRVVYRMEKHPAGEHILELDLTGVKFRPGMYLLKVTDEKGNVAIVKITRR